ncbi:hypothetical protein GCM10012286_81070 [Streptomyces lasiicapitis]|uniref:Uncharacterized protein n=1 Tax=Streptomyces lasiicapitis TaxID=1923961 RepID=A0ABQ2MWW6_9ACTN|nr:hypothetical protein GCM10012286_81070 [Streptomyces lasiicapitis]
MHAGEFDRQLLVGPQIVVLADSEHRVPQTANEELSHRYFLGPCCCRCRERDTGGCRGRESKELPSPHWVVALLPPISSQPRGGKAWVRETRGDKVSVSGLHRGRNRSEPELLGRNIEYIREASEDVDVGQRRQAPLVPGDLGGRVTGPDTEISERPTPGLAPAANQLAVCSGPFGSVSRRADWHPRPRR